MDGRRSEVAQSPGHTTLVSVLLSCGALAAIVYVATDVLAAMRWEGYRYADRAVSELLAMGSPTRSFILGPMTAYNLLMIAFGIGVWFAAGGRRALRITSVLLVTYGVASWTGLVLFPLRPDSARAVGDAMSTSGVLHSAITFVLVLLMFAFMFAGSGARGRGFRAYTIVTVLVVLLGGVLAGSQVDRVSAGVATPWFGLIERSNIYSSLLWVAVLAIALLRSVRVRPSARTADAQSEPVEKTVTVFVGSPHRGGATYEAAGKFVAALEEYGDVRAEIISLADYDIGVCRGCKVCMDRSEELCPLKDDRDVLIDKMNRSDAVVFAAPNYSFQVAAVMKIFLDRLGFLFHRPRYHGKTSSAIVVQGIYGGRKVRKYLEFVGGGLGFNVVRGSVIRTLLPMTEEAIAKMDSALMKQAARFHEQLLKPPHRAPSLFALVMFRMARTAMKQSGREQTRDYAYYSERGWFDSDYYYPTHLGVLKKAVGAMSDWAVKRMPAFKVDRPVNG